MAWCSSRVDPGSEFMGDVKNMAKHDVRSGNVNVHRDQGIVERFNQTLSKSFFSYQYSQEINTKSSERSREWVKRLPGRSHESFEWRGDSFNRKETRWRYQRGGWLQRKETRFFSKRPISLYRQRTRRWIEASHGSKLVCARLYDWEVGSERRRAGIILFEIWSRARIRQRGVDDSSDGTQLPPVLNWYDFSGTCIGNQTVLKFIEKFKYFGKITKWSKISNAIKIPTEVKSSLIFSGSTKFPRSFVPKLTLYNYCAWSRYCENCRISYQKMEGREDVDEISKRYWE